MAREKQPLPKVSNGFVKAGDFNLYYETCESSKGAHVKTTTLLTLHGGPGFTHHQLLPLSKLSDREPSVKVVFYDQAGCGHSDRIKDLGKYVIERAVDEVEDIRRNLRLGTVSLLGHSYGASLALEYALKYGENLSSLIISSGAASIPKTVDAFQKLKRDMPIDVQQVLEKYEAIGDYDNPEYKKAVEELYKKHVFRAGEFPSDLAASLNGFNPDVYWTMWGKHEFVCTGNMRDWDITDRLYEIKVPTLFLVGRYDELPLELTEEMHSRVKNSKVVILENSSHFGMFEEQEKYLDSVYQFLTEKQFLFR